MQTQLGQVETEQGDGAPVSKAAAALRERTYTVTVTSDIEDDAKALGALVFRKGSVWSLVRRDEALWTFNAGIYVQEGDVVAVEGEAVPVGEFCWLATVQHNFGPGPEVLFQALVRGITVYAATEEMYAELEEIRAAWRLWEPATSNGVQLPQSDAADRIQILRPEELPTLWKPPDGSSRLGRLEGASIQAIPDAFPGGVGRLANNSLIFAGMQAIWKGGGKARTLTQGWRPSSSGRPIYEHHAAKGGTIVVYPNLSHTAADPVPTTEMFWSFVESLSPFTGDVVLAVLAQLCEPSAGDRPKYPLLEPVRVTTQAIAHYKGIQRWGQERRLLDERIYEEMERIRGLTFDVQGVVMDNPASGKWDKNGFSWDGDQFFNVVRVEQYQESIFGDRERIEVSWSVRAGQWAYYWLNAQGRVYIGHMAKALLEMDHQGTAMAKKLGQRVVLLSEALKLRSATLRISSLLEDIGELPQQEQRSGNWAGRTRDRFDEAMLALQEAGVFACVEWPDGHAPGGPDRARGWAQKWLTASVRITLPDTAPEPPRQLAPPRRRGGGRHRTIPSKEQRVGGLQIRQARLDRQWSQPTLAQHLGITVPYLSQLENEKRVPSKELATKLRAWLVAT